jgi:hypothetical protein
MNFKFDSDLLYVVLILDYSTDVAQNAYYCKTNTQTEQDSSLSFFFLFHETRLHIH